MERLIKLIDEGDPEVILAEDLLIPQFNELLKYELVQIKDDRVFLTEKGHLAKVHGLEFMLEQEKLQKGAVKKAFAIRIGARNYTAADLRIKLGVMHILVLILLFTLALLYFYLPMAEN